MIDQDDEHFYRIVINDDVETQWECPVCNRKIQLLRRSQKRRYKVLNKGDQLATHPFTTNLGRGDASTFMSTPTVH